MKEKKFKYINMPISITQNWKTQSLMVHVELLCTKTYVPFKAAGQTANSKNLSIWPFQSMIEAAFHSFENDVWGPLLRYMANISSRDQWTDCIIGKIFQNIEILKSITTALKSILKLVKLQSLVAKCCKMQKKKACKICKLCILLYYARKTDTTIEKTVSIFPT